MRRLPRIEDLDRPALIGERYSVPCIRIASAWLPRGWWPVLGALHGDKELGIAEAHYHYDQRFLDEAQIAYYDTFSETSRVAIYQVVTPERSIFAHGRRNLTVLRQFDYPSLGARSLQPRLRPSCAGGILPCGRCPHRGFDLRQVAPDANGLKTCPGHGLQFVAATGEPSWMADREAAHA